MHLAQKIGGAIINADSCQLYHELPTLTASPSITDKNCVPHYLYNYLALEYTFSAAKYAEHAAHAIQDAKAKNLIPIVVGGSGMYIKILLEGISAIPEIPYNVREDARLELQTLGKQAFYHKLSSADPAIIGKILPTDAQRMLRAYEVIAHTNRSITYYQSIAPNIMYPDAKIIMLNPTRDLLYNTCDARFDQLVRDGAIEEVRSVLHKVDDVTVKILGFRELADYIRGVTSLQDALSNAKTKTRRYAKRQVTWFKNQMQNKVVIDFASIEEFTVALDEI